MPSTRPDSSGRQRDPLLDLWRGLALVDMAWVHLAAYPIGLPLGLAPWISDHTRFAAGCFVLLSGMTVSRVFGPGLAAKPERARATRHRLLRRAALLLLVDRLAALGFAAIEYTRLVPPGVHPPLPDFFALATFGEAGVTGGLLLMYAVLLAATPALETLRARFGGFTVAALSLTIYALALAAGPSAHWPPWAFPVAHWQALFVAGYLTSPQVGRLRNRDGDFEPRWLGGVSLACVALFTLRSGGALGLDPAWLPAWDFTKVPLQPAEFAWYLTSSAFVLTWSAWIFERGPRARASLAWLCALGRKSLLVYVAHLFLELPIVEVVTLFEPSPLVCTMMLPAMALGMRAVAAAGEWVERWKPPAGEHNPLAMLRRALPAAGTTGGGLAVATVAFLLVLQAIVEPPASWKAMRGAESGMLAQEEEEEDARAPNVSISPSTTLPEGSPPFLLRRAEATMDSPPQDALLPIVEETPAVEPPMFP